MFLWGMSDMSVISSGNLGFPNEIKGKVLKVSLDGSSTSALGCESNVLASPPTPSAESSNEVDYSI